MELQHAAAGRAFPVLYFSAIAFFFIACGMKTASRVWAGNPGMAVFAVIYDGLFLLRPVTFQRLPAGEFRHWRLPVQPDRPVAHPHSAEARHFGADGLYRRSYSEFLGTLLGILLAGRSGAVGFPTCLGHQVGGGTEGF